jgi:hypothetical protein
MGGQRKVHDGHGKPLTRRQTSYRPRIVPLSLHRWNELGQQLLRFPLRHLKLCDPQVVLQKLDGVLWFLPTPPTL